MAQEAIQVNNAQQVLMDMQMNNTKHCYEHLTMLEIGTAITPRVSDSNIHNNTQFLLDLWD